MKADGQQELRSARSSKWAVLLAAIGISVSGCASVMEWANAPESHRLPDGRCRNPSDPTTTVPCEQEPPLIATTKRRDHKDQISDQSAQVSAQREAAIPGWRRDIEAAQRQARDALRVAPWDETTKTLAERVLQERADNELNATVVQEVQYDARRAVEAATSAKAARATTQREQAARQAEEQKKALSAASETCWPDIPACEKACAADKDPFTCTVLGIAHVHGSGGASISARGATRLFRLVCDEIGNNVGCDAQKSVQQTLAKCESDDCQRWCDAGFTVACDRSCEHGNDPACSHGSAKSQAIGQRRKLARNLPLLFSRCVQNRAKIEQLRIAGIEAARAGNEKQAQAATQKLQELEPEWAETLDLIQEGIELTTVNASGERDQKRYVELTRRAQECSCEPTQSGRCR